MGEQLALRSSSARRALPWVRFCLQKNQSKCAKILQTKTLEIQSLQFLIPSLLVQMASQWVFQNHMEQNKAYNMLGNTILLFDSIFTQIY